MAVVHPFQHGTDEHVAARATVPANAHQFLATTEFALLEIVFAECGICMRVCMGVQVVASKLYIRWVLGGTRSRAELVWLVVSDILL